MGQSHRAGRLHRTPWWRHRFEHSKRFKRFRRFEMSEISALFELAELCTARNAPRRTSGAAEPRTRCRPSREGEGRTRGRNAHGRGRSGGPDSRGEGQATPAASPRYPRGSGGLPMRPPCSGCPMHATFSRGVTEGGAGAAKRERHVRCEGSDLSRKGAKDQRNEEPKESKEATRTKGRRTREYPAGPPHPRAAVAADTRGGEGT